MIDRDKHRAVYEDVMKQLDKLENEYLPQVTCSPTEVCIVSTSGRRCILWYSGQPEVWSWVLMFVETVCETKICIQSTASWQCLCHFLVRAKIYWTVTANGCMMIPYFKILYFIIWWRIYACCLSSLLLFSVFVTLFLWPSTSATLSYRSNSVAIKWETVILSPCSLNMICCFYFPV